MIDFLDILEKYGPSAACFAALAVYVARDWRTIAKLEIRVAELEKGFREVLSGLVDRSEKTLTQTNKLIERLLLKD